MFVVLTNVFNLKMISVWRRVRNVLASTEKVLRSRCQVLGKWKSGETSLYFYIKTFVLRIDCLKSFWLDYHCQVLGKWKSSETSMDCFFIQFFFKDWLSFHFLMSGLYLCCWSTLSSWWSGSTSDETDIVWSEALFALTCCSSKQ